MQRVETERGATCCCMPHTIQDATNLPGIYIIDD